MNVLIEIQNKKVKFKSIGTVFMDRPFVSCTTNVYSWFVDDDGKLFLYVDSLYMLALCININII